MISSIRHNLRRRIGRSLTRTAGLSVALGLHPRRSGYRAVRECSLPEYFERPARAGETLDAVHAPTVFHNALPLNVADARELPDDAGWWGYSFRDVPHRRSEATHVATLRDAMVVVARDPARNDDFYPAILTADGRALRMREMRWRPIHREVLRTHAVRHVERPSAWFLERVYDNHSHWLTAHLPKLRLLGERGLADPSTLILPLRRSPVIETTLAQLGISAGEHQATDVGVYRFDTLTVCDTDRFRPELLTTVRESVAPTPHAKAGRRLYISRRLAARRRLRNEESLWPGLAAQGFECICLEKLAFQEQIDMMQQAGVVVAPHGAGLTNVLYARPGITVIEIADPAFPNPNFYALCAAMGHRYGWVQARSVGDGHPLEKDLCVDPAAVMNLLSWISQDHGKRLP